MSYYKVKYGDISVSYLPVLDGGGMTFGQEYLQVIRNKTGKVGHIFEFCAGPGFIGFSLLAHGLCDKLTLADINPEAVKAARVTVAENGLEDRVSVYLSDGLKDIPASEKWDLVVSNPPHFDGDADQYRDAIRLIDPGMEIHKAFYRDVKKHLNPGGHVIFQENGQATTSEDFTQMIRDAGLEYVDVFRVNSAYVPPVRQETKKSSRAHALVKKAMRPVEMLLMNRTLERAVKDNDLYRWVSTRPVFVPKHMYYLWSRAPQSATVRAAS
ncbi:MAG: class I SAM-dependent methyltransferase [Myxococcaceae bacterium]|nr:class I SAM-dependent methyltransferase [Myxococcaceae bacterium]